MNFVEGLKSMSFDHTKLSCGGDSINSYRRTISMIPGPVPSASSCSFQHDSHSCNTKVGCKFDNKRYISPTFWEERGVVYDILFWPFESSILWVPNHFVQSHCEPCVSRQCWTTGIFPQFVLFPLWQPTSPVWKEKAKYNEVKQFLGDTVDDSQPHFHASQSHFSTCNL